MSTTPTPEQSAAPSDQAMGSANLADALRAAWRLHYYRYHEWSVAGGLNECRHGIAQGIHCERCDEMLLRNTYEQLSSPNTKLSEPPHHE